jgi:hypothetical protein
MANQRHKIGNVTVIIPADNCIALTQGSDMVFITIDEARQIAALIDEV